MKTPSIQFSSRQITRLALALCVCSPCVGALSQISTSTTFSLSPTQIYVGTAPLATVTVVASDHSSPNSTATCAIQTRGHAASYSANVSNGTAGISLSSIAQVPVGTYSVVCSYAGSAAYAPSSTSSTTFQVLATTPTTTTVSQPSAQTIHGNTPVANCLCRCEWGFNAERFRQVRRTCPRPYCSLLSKPIERQRKRFP